MEFLKKLEEKLNKFRILIIVVGLGVHGFMWFLDRMGWNIPSLIIWVVGVFSILMIVVGLYLIIKEMWIGNSRKRLFISLFISILIFVLGYLWTKSTRLTVYSLFNNEYANPYGITTITNHGVDYSDGRSYKFQSKVYMDFEANTKFAGYYIPKESHPAFYYICETVAVHDVAFQGIEKNEYEFEGGGLGAYNLEDLASSGRVFIYHELPIFRSNRDKLTKLFIINKKSVEFRGQDYLEQRVGKKYFKVRRRE